MQLLFNIIKKRTFLKQKKKETIISILEKYYYQKFKNNLISERSYAIYQNIILILKNNLINLPIQSITIKDIENLNDKILNFSNETISKIWYSLNLAFKIAYRHNIIKYNIMQDEMIFKPRSNKIQSKIEALTVAEQSKLINILNNELQNFTKYEYFIYAILLCLYTGMRIGETLALCKDAIDLENNTLTVKRTLSTNKERENLFKKSYKNL